MVKSVQGQGVCRSEEVGKVQGAWPRLTESRGLTRHFGIYPKMKEEAVTGFKQLT